MKTVKYAVAIVKGENETILGVFASEKDADEFAKAKRIPHEAGLCYCFSAPFRGRKLLGKSIRIHSFYNA
jgi:hypothetical protein